MLLRRLLLLLACAMAPGAWGESPAELLHRQTHTVVLVHAHRSPFPSNLVSALTLDREGYVWAGTVAGLARYDGRGWRLVEMPIPPHRTWVNNNALGLLEDGTLWVGTRTEGLFLRKDGRWSHLGKADGLPGNAINALLESRLKDDSGRPILYVGTYGSGLARRVGGRWEPLDVGYGATSNQIFTLAEDPQGRLWVGTRGGLYILEKGRFRPFEHAAELPSQDIRQVLWTRDADGQPELWLGGLVGGLCAWKGGRLVRHEVGGRGVSHIIPAHGGGIWVSFWGGGLAHWNGHHWQTWTKEDGLPSAHLRCLLEVEEDGRSVLWMGSDGRGIFRTAEGGWRQFQPRWSGEVEVRAFTEGADGAFWMAGRNFGLLRFDGRAWKRWDLPVKTTTGDIRCLAWYRGELWAGCDLELMKLGPGGLNIALPTTVLDRKIVRCLAVGGGRLWVGSSVGLYSWDGQRVENLPLPGGHSFNSIRSLAWGAEGLWIGTDAGVFRPGPGGTPTLVEGLAQADGILALSLLGGTVWMGTSSGHIYHWEAGKLASLGEEPGRGAVQALLVAGRGTTLYVGTTRGVETWDLASGRLLARTTLEDGLPDEECLPGSLYEDLEGRVWAGSSNGAGVLDPAGPRLAPRSKPLRLEEAVSASGPRFSGDVLPRGETWLDVGFALMAHHREEDTRYRTQLLPVEASPGQWVPEGHRRLQSLPRGTYVLRIWAKDYQGLQSGPVEFPFRVVGRIWEHPAFLAIGSLALLATGGFLARSRMAARARVLEGAVTRATSQLQRQKGELEELTRQQQEIMGILAHDIRNPLSGIGLVAELLDDEPEEAERRKGLRRIQSAVSNVNDLLNQFLSLQSMETGALEVQVNLVTPAAVLRDLAFEFGPQAERKEQRIRVEAVEARALADHKVLHEVLANLLSNALKYSPRGSEVVMRALPVHEGFLRLEVADQGPGLTESDRTRLFQRFAKLSAKPTGGEGTVGLGLAICKRLVEAMNGRIGADSEPGLGATFWVELPGVDAGD